MAVDRSQTLALNPARDEGYWRTAQVVNQLARGKSNNVGEITLRASQTTTTLIDPLIGPQSYIDFMPTTSNAATAKADLYVSARTAGQATLTHASSANTDQTFVYVVVG
jgi:hypothetical protein